jgi:magnesium-transporting ATPase (P-type)
MGIKVWLLTGDKQETAINIGMSSKLISDDMNILILSGKNMHECGGNLEFILQNIKTNSFGNVSTYSFD